MPVLMSNVSFSGRYRFLLLMCRTSHPHQQLSPCTMQLCSMCCHKEEDFFIHLEFCSGTTPQLRQTLRTHGADEAAKENVTIKKRRAASARICSTDSVPKNNTKKYWMKFTKVQLLLHILLSYIDACLLFSY